MIDSLFDFPELHIDKKIRLIELFGGIGSQAMALRDIGADFEHYKLVEFDKYAVASYNAIHDTRHTTHDIRQIHASDLEIIDKDKYCYLMTYSFPCTDLSVAGKMQGMSKKDWEEGNSTRSGLLWEVERILKECKQEELPDVLLMENVPQVHAEANRADFDSWLNFLKSKGYWNFWKDLNAKDFGIPQNRDRCFCASILSKDFIDFEFPEPVKLEKVMKDYLEDTVGEKYYINTGKAKALIQNLLTNNQENQNCVQINYNNDRAVETIDLSLKNTKKIEIANCISARNDRSISNLESEGSGVIERFCVAMRGRTPERPTVRTIGLPTVQRLEKAPEGMVNTLSTVQKDNLVLEKQMYYRIRKLTPRETWRLMGYTDTDFEKAAEVNSNTQLYRESGNAIVKQVMMAIFLQMGIKGLKKWEERSEEEKAELIRGSIYDKADFQ